MSLTRSLLPALLTPPSPEKPKAARQGTDSRGPRALSCSLAGTSSGRGGYHQYRPARVALAPSRPAVGGRGCSPPADPHLGPRWSPSSSPDVETTPTRFECRDESWRPGHDRTQVKSLG